MQTVIWEKNFGNSKVENLITMKCLQVLPEDLEDFMLGHWTRLQKKMRDDIKQEIYDEGYDAGYDDGKREGNWCSCEV